jgi:hypothetical protein
MLVLLVPPARSKRPPVGSFALGGNASICQLSAPLHPFLQVSLAFLWQCAYFFLNVGALPVGTPLLDWVPI